MEDNDYEEDTNYSYSSLLPVILLKEFNGKGYGDIIEVTRGLYNTLLNLKIGMAVLDYEDVKGNQRLVATAREHEKENEEVWKENSELYDKIEVLKKELKDYKDKMLKKDKTRTK